MALSRGHRDGRSRLLALCVLPAIAIACFLTSCKTLKAVPLEEVDAISEQSFTDREIEVTANRYTKSTFFITVRNKYQGFRLREIPEAVSSTGAVFSSVRRSGPEFSFNYTPKSRDAVNGSDRDIVIRWILEETGEDAFIITGRTITIDIESKSGPYFVKAVRIDPIKDTE